MDLLYYVEIISLYRYIANSEATETHNVSP
jgi:hypothetical protein